MEELLDNRGLIIAIEVISYCIIALLGAGVVVRAVALYNRYKESKKVIVPVQEDGKVLKILQEGGDATIVCKDIEGIPEEVETKPVEKKNGKRKGKKGRK